MRRDPRAYLWDMREAAAAIAAFTSGLDESGYEASPLVQAAVERKFEIIGEAASQLIKHHPALGARLPEYRQIIAFRNLLIHGYATVEHRRVWAVVHQVLPGFEAVLKSLLKEIGA